MIDRERVSVTGASNGAMMSYRLGCERPERFAAIAAVAGSLPVNLACRPSEPLSVMAISGTDDPLMPFNGGEVRFGPQRLGRVLSARETIERWAAFAGCGRAGGEEALPNRAPLDRTRVYRTRFPGCQAGAAVEFYRVDGGGHTWPGGPQVTSRAIVGATSRDMDATDVIWDFFTARRRPQQSPGVPAATGGWGPFGSPERIEIVGYGGHVMEPAVSRDGAVLVFNDRAMRVRTRISSGRGGRRRAPFSSWVLYFHQKDGSRFALYRVARARH